MKRLVLTILLMSGVPAHAQQDDLRALVMSATAASDFDAPSMQLDVYRALLGADVSLSTPETIAAAMEASTRGYGSEAAAIASALFPEGVPRDEEAAGFASFMGRLRQAAAQDRDGGLARSVETAEHRYSASLWIITAQAFAGADDHARAVEYYLRGLVMHEPGETEVRAWASKASLEYRRAVEFYRLALGPGRSRLTPQELALAQLNLGVSLFKLGRVDEARTAWASIDGNAAVEILAQVWIGVADRAAE